MRFTFLTALILLLSCSTMLHAAATIPPLEETIPIDQGHVFWQQWLLPNEVLEGLPASAKPATFRYWHNDIPETKASGERGYATYLAELPPLHAGRYEIGFEYISSAYDVYLIPVDRPEQAVMLEVGHPGKTAEEEIPYLAKRALAFQVSGTQEKWLLLMHVSNFARSEGGFWALPQLSPGRVLSQELKTKALINYAVMGAMVIMALYQLMMFFRNRADRAAVYLFLICMGVFVRVMGFENVVGEWVPQVYDGFWFDTLTRMEYLPMACMAPLFTMFVVHTFQDIAYNRLALKLIGIGAGLFCVYTLTATPYQIQKMLVFYQASVFGTVCYGILLITRAVKRHETGSIYILVSVLLPFSMAIFDIVLANLGIHRSISHFGAAAFVFLQSQVLAQRFALAFRRVDHLSRELQREVRHQTAQIRHIMDHVPQGLGLLDQRLALQSVYSTYLEKMFGQQQLSARPFLPLLDEHLVTDTDRMIVFRSAIEAVMGETELTWELNQDQFLRQAQTRDGRYLEIDWHPIVTDDTVQEILVAVRDVTELRVLTERAQEQDAELKRIGEILALSQRDRGTLQNLVENTLQECRAAMGTAQTILEKRRAILVHLHTLKGSARQLGLAQLATAVHEAEHRILDLHKSIGHPREFVAAVSGRLDGIRERWVEYQSLMERLQLGSSSSMETSLEYDLIHIANGLGTLALAQNKYPPTLDLQMDGVRLSRDHRHVLGKIWLHLVTNSIEHGLDSKPARGTICLQATQKQGDIELIYSDNGRGLNIPGIRAKAERLGLLPKNARPSLDEIATLIFAEGFSTSDQISEASGRGIGMDAIRLLMESIQGSVTLHLVPGSSEYCRFQIRLQFPRYEHKEAVA